MISTMNPNYQHTELSERILSFGRESLVQEVEIEGETLIQKCYFPERFKNYDQVYAQIRTDPYRGISHSAKRRLQLFHKEAHILRQVSQFPAEAQFSPAFKSMYPKQRSIFMEKIAAETFRECYLKSGDLQKKNEKFVDVLITFHDIVGKYFDDMYTGMLIDKSPALQPRTRGEEKERWTRYFKTIIYRTSREFREYCKEDDQEFESAGNNPKARKTALDNFLMERKIELGEMVDEFIKRDWRISFGERYAQKKTLVRSSDTPKEQLKTLKQLYQDGFLSLIHGDFNPMNVFNVTRGIKICDFPDMRMDRRTIDVMGAVYNIYNNPHNKEQELDAFELIRKYINGVKENERISLDPGRFIIQTLESRLKYGGVGLFAIDCKYIAPEMRIFIEGWKKFPLPEDDADLEKTFLQTMFVERFKGFADYILRGEGSGIIWGLENAGIFRKQVELVENIFERTGVISPTASARRADRFEDVVR